LVHLVQYVGGKTGEPDNKKNENILLIYHSMNDQNATLKV